jgi:hypothetical protein
MVLLCKQKALYVKCCIIANGITDSQGDTLYAEDIKKIFTSFNNQDNFEVYHNDIPIQEVSLLENYISTANETIGTAVVPSGSWNAVIRVDNPDIQQALLTGEFQGVSLNNRIADRCKANLSGQVRYKDIADAECVIPLLISFVKKGANGYGLHVMDYDAYILKSKDIVKERGAKNMAFDLLGGLKKLVQQAEADNEPIIVKEDPTEEDGPVVKKEETAEEEKEEEAEIQKEDKAESEDEKEEEEAEVTKEDGEAEIEDDDFEAKVTAIVEKILAEKLEAKEDEVIEKEDEPEDEDTPKITKSQKVIDDTPGQPIENTNYYSISGRDPDTGCKIRN